MIPATIAHDFAAPSAFLPLAGFIVSGGAALRGDKMKPQMLLTMHLTDGREVSVKDDVWGVMARLSFAQSQPNFMDFTINEI